MIPYDATVALPFGYRGIGINSFVNAVQVICNLTTQGYEDWKLKTYQSIMNAYSKKRLDHEEALSAAQIADGVKISGENPEINRVIGQTELKRACITLWTGYQFNGVTMIDIDSGINPHLPKIDVDNTIEMTPEIQFLEQSFDWNSMIYEFYPYYWTKKKRWVDMFAHKDTDPLFQDFLRSGAARVLVPVHVGATEGPYSWITGR